MTNGKFGKVEKIKKVVGNTDYLQRNNKTPPDMIIDGYIFLPIYKNKITVLLNY